MLLLVFEVGLPDLEVVMSVLAGYIISIFTTESSLTSALRHDKRNDSGKSLM